MQHRWVHILLAVTVLSGTGSAQSSQAPQVIEFDGTNGFSFPAHPSLSLSDGGTIEFWVAADWTADPGYDPAIVSNTGPEGALYTIAILGRRDGISLQTGDAVDALAFDFSDGALHHVAVVDLVDAAAIMVDGQVIGTLNTHFQDLPSAGLWVGSADGAAAPFAGAVAGLRFWDVALSRADLAAWSMADVTSSDEPHPDVENLIAIADFADGSLAFAETYFDAGNETEIAALLAQPDSYEDEGVEE